MQGLGATEFRFVEEGGSFWTVMLDPEGNEFCVLRGPRGRLESGRVSGKVATMRDAVAELVRDGDTVAIEGFTHLICFAAGHEIIRQRRRDLTLARMTPDVIYDQMVGAGVARKLIFSWLGNPGVGLAPRRAPADRARGPRAAGDRGVLALRDGVPIRRRRLEPAVLPDPLVLRERHPEREPEHQAHALPVRGRRRGLRRAAAAARRHDRPRAARHGGRRHPDLGAARVPEGGGVRRPSA